MNLKKFFSLFMVLAAVMNCLGAAGAQSAEIERLSEWDRVLLTAAETEHPISRSSGPVSMTISAKSAKTSSTSFSLDAGETVRFDCTYSPKYSSVDFGLIAPDGYFYYTNSTSGSIDKTIQIEEAGTYTLAIRNNSSVSITVVGTVYY